jgi:hypothetical protein
MEATTDRRRRIYITGVFDMQNYGDLLFPIVARHRLEAFGIDVVPIAPTNNPTGIPDAINAAEIHQLLGDGPPADAILVGGGYVIHTHPMDFLEAYQLGDTGEWAATGLWLGATIAAALRDIPILWNAPGVPHPFSGRQRGIVEAALRATDYVSVRDRGAAELLAAPADIPVHVVPDPIADLARVWPFDSLNDSFHQFVQRKGGRGDERYLALHLRNRSVAGSDMTELARQLEIFADRHGFTPVLVAVGHSHDDPGTARNFSRHLGIRHVLLDDPLSLREITAVLAHAALYVGASLHGYVAASAYGVPGVLVARPAYRKFAGFLEHTGRMDDFVRDWPSAFQVGTARAGEPRRERIPSSVHAALDAHWARIKTGIDDPEAGRTARTAFLKATLRQGMASAGARWAVEPFLSRVGRQRSAADGPAR